MEHLTYLEHGAEAIIDAIPWARELPRQDNPKYLLDNAVRRIIQEPSLVKRPLVITAGIGTLTHDGHVATFEAASRNPARAAQPASPPAWWAMWEGLQDPNACTFSSIGVARLHAKMHAELAPGGQACAACQRPAILRKYQQLARKLHEADSEKI